MRTITLSEEGKAPFENYNDLQDFLDALDKEALEIWNTKLSQDVADNHALHAAIALYCKEMNIDQIPEDESLMHHLYTKLSLSISLHHNVKEGTLIQKGRMSMLNDDATFSMSQSGIDKVEKMIGKK